MHYHYTDSGLDDVFLVNGYHLHKTPYGEGVSITNTERLHKAIGQSIVERPNRINGAELRFLRLEMELTQRRLAALIDATEQKVRRWELARKKPIPDGPADRIVRAIYSEYIGGDGSVRRMVDRLAELDEREREAIRLQETEDHRWIAAVA